MKNVNFESQCFRSGDFTQIHLCAYIYMHSDVVDTDSFLIYPPLRLVWWSENV